MSTDPPPLPLRAGDIRIPEAVWEKIRCPDGESGCWVWEGKTTPSGSPVHRRRAVWRWLYEKLCKLDPKELPRVVPPTCGNDTCVNPDHRVPPELRGPKFNCPTCGTPTALQYYADPRLPPATEKAVPQYRRIRQRLGIEPEPEQRRKISVKELDAEFGRPRGKVPFSPPTGRWCVDGTTRRVEFRNGRVVKFENLTREERLAFYTMDQKVQVDGEVFEQEIQAVMTMEGD